MGDRGNIVIRGQYGDVWLYTHYHGSEMKDVLQTVLARKQRWEDAAYLARIIFSELIRDDVDGELGFGISTNMLDNEHGILIVDVPNQKVVRMEETQLDRNAGTGNGVLPNTLDYRVSRNFTEYAENGFKGPRKRVERRLFSDGRATDRRDTQPKYGSLDRRHNTGRRKGDY